MNLDEYCDHCAKKNGLKQSSFIKLCKKGASAHVMCKGCGLTSVDYKGKCLKCKTPAKRIGIFITLFFIFIVMLIALI